MVFVTSSTNKIKELGASNQDHNWENRDRDSILFMIFIASSKLLVLLYYHPLQRVTRQECIAYKTNF